MPSEFRKAFFLNKTPKKNILDSFALKFNDGK